VVKTIALVGFLSLAAAFNAYAHDGDRIDRLEKEIQETKLRLQRLESSLGQSSNVQEPITSAEGWKSVMNWKKLAKDMSASDVRKILGEPLQLDGGTFARWYYQNRGVVMFFEGRVSRWEEPRQ
jgi:outer membrane protein assembly factor BamE (lipoprotein component of BamABCDE complex)